MSVAFTPEPRHKQLSHMLRKRLMSGDLQPGDRFLSVRDISREYAVSPVTAHKSIQELLADEVLVAKPARGYFVGKAIAQRVFPAGPLITVLAGEALRDNPRVLSSEILRGLRERLPSAHIRQEFLAKADPAGFFEAMIDRDGRAANEKLFVLPSPDPKLRQFAVERELPAVVYGSLEADTQLPCVEYDEYNLAYTATRLLLAKGHQRVFFLDRDTWVYGNSLRYEGFVKALLEEGAIKDRAEADRYYVRVPSVSTHAQATVQRLLKNASGPIAIVCNADQYAAWAIRIAAARRIQIPEQLMLVSLQGGELAEQLTPRLTSIPECGYEVGIGIGNLLDKLWKGEHISNPRSVIRAEIVERETT